MQSVGPGHYWLQSPVPHCKECFSKDPRVRLAKSGNSKCADKALIDVDSELKQITRRASNCPFDKFIPSDRRPYCKQMKHMPPCNDEKFIAEDTRISNPPCTLRGTHNGFNRWEWLCQNPQARVEVPFDVQINSRMLAKDNHRPCLPKPIDPALALPAHRHSDEMMSGIPKDCYQKWPGETLVHWRKCAEIRDY